MTETPQRLKELRKEKNITLKEMSKKVGINISTISNYENGYSIPKPDKLKVLAKFYGVSESYLLGYSKYKNSDIYVKKRLKEISDEDEYNLENNNDYDDKYFDDKRFIVEMEGALLDKVGDEKFKKIKNKILKVTGISKQLIDEEDVDTYAFFLENFMRLGLHPLDEDDDYEIGDFLSRLLNINIEYFLLSEENSKELSNFLNYLLIKQEATVNQT